MPQTFLTAEWRNLIMANYTVDPSILKKYIPCNTELDSFNGVYYISIVGFLFQNTKIAGIKIPFHHTFEEVNLRFYVRYKEEGIWKRGVVFLKELVPKYMIAFVANTLYKENYKPLSMKHDWAVQDDTLHVAYYWKVDEDWNYIKAVADREPKSLISGSPEEFITEHYWGYTFISNSCTGTYEVQHPNWRIHTVQSYSIHCNAERLYGNDFSPFLLQEPASVFLAEGSAVEVKKGARIFK